jgi:hypothetical protein
MLTKLAILAATYVAAVRACTGAVSGRITNDDLLTFYRLACPMQSRHHPILQLLGPVLAKSIPLHGGNMLKKAVQPPSQSTKAAQITARRLPTSKVAFKPLLVLLLGLQMVQLRLLANTGFSGSTKLHA